MSNRDRPEGDADVHRTDDVQDTLDPVHVLQLLWVPVAHSRTHHASSFDDAIGSLEVASGRKVGRTWQRVLGALRDTDGRRRH